MSLGWDDEAPTGFQDADLELAEFEAEAERELTDYSREEPYMTAAELRFEADLDEQSAWEDSQGLNDY